MELWKVGRSNKWAFSGHFHSIRCIWYSFFSWVFMLFLHYFDSFLNLYHIFLHDFYFYKHLNPRTWLILLQNFNVLQIHIFPIATENQETKICSDCILFQICFERLERIHGILIWDFSQSQNYRQVGFSVKCDIFTKLLNKPIVEIFKMYFYCQTVSAFRE